MGSSSGQPGQLFRDADRLQKQDEDPGCWFLHSDSTAMFEGLEVGRDHSSIVVPAVTATSKLFTDARGWLAHAHHSTLFLRVFPDLTLDQAAPRQAEVEMYFDAERDYIEFENQGAYVTLAPGQSLTYPVEWRFRAIDPELPTDRISPELFAEIHAELGPRRQVARPGSTRSRDLRTRIAEGLTTPPRAAILGQMRESAL